MDFTGIDDTQLTGTWLANAEGDVVIVTYTAGPPAGYNINGKAFDLLFDYKGGFSSDLTFDEPNCEVANADLGLIASTYVNGSVEQTTAVGTASMTDLTADIGSTVLMPLDMAGAFSTVGSLTYFIEFDEFELAFTGIIGDELTGVTANANGGILEINWSGNGSTIDLSASHLFDMQFEYYGGNATLDFIPGCEVVDGDLAVLAVDYTNGGIEATPGTASLTLATAVGDSAEVVHVPIEAADFGSDELGAITMNISYDNSLMTYTTYSAQQLSGWVVSGNANGEITLNWSSNQGGTLDDGDVVLLQFLFGEVAGEAELMFEPGSIVKDVNLDTYPVSFNHGLIVSSFTVSGQLTYMGDAGRVIGTSGSSVTTVQLKSVADSSVAYSTTADANGNYSFSDVVPGSFFLDAMTTIDGSQSYTIADAYTVYGYAQTGNGLPTALQLLAADVNMDGSVSVTDAYMIYGSVNNSYIKPSNWLAAEWIFDNIVVTVSADVNQDFSGITSGDANADFISTP